MKYINKKRKKKRKIKKENNCEYNAKNLKEIKYTASFSTFDYIYIYDLLYHLIDL